MRLGDVTYVYVTQLREFYSQLKINRQVARMVARRA